MFCVVRCGVVGVVDGFVVVDRVGKVVRVVRFCGDWWGRRAQ